MHACIHTIQEVLPRWSTMYNKVGVTPPRNNPLYVSCLGKYACMHAFVINVIHNNTIYNIKAVLKKFPNSPKMVWIYNRRSIAPSVWLDQPNNVSQMQWYHHHVSSSTWVRKDHLHQQRGSYLLKQMEMADKNLRITYGIICLTCYYSQYT